MSGERGVNETARAARRYAVAEPILFEVKKRYRAGLITWQQAQTIKGQTLAGDMGGAWRGLKKLVKREAQTHAETPEAVE